MRWTDAGKRGADVATWWFQQHIRALPWEMGVWQRVASAGNLDVSARRRDSMGIWCVSSSMDSLEVTVSPPVSPAQRAQTIDDLYRAHGDAMFRVAIAVVRDRGLAEDVVQESIIKAWRNLGSLRQEGSLLAWLLRIVHNTAVSLLRRLRDTPLDPLAIPERLTEHVESDAVDRSFITAFEIALFDLDELSRAVVVLRELEDLPYDVIAEALDVPLSTVKTRLFRARRRLAESLSDWKPV